MPDDTKPAEDLPRWDLSDLYPAPGSPEVGADLDRSAREAKAFRGEFEGKLASLSGAALGAAIGRYETIEERLGRLQSFAQLAYAADMSDAELGRFQQTVLERSTDISAELLFFALELNRIDDAALAAQLQREGTESFDKSWQDLMDRIAAKSTLLETGHQTRAGRP